MPEKQPKERKIKITSAKGRPMLAWVGKKPLDYVKGYPTQLLEISDPSSAKGGLRMASDSPGTPSYKALKNNWRNLLFHGDNKDVLATLLEQGFRGKIDLIYIDPPFMSGTDYVRKVELRGVKETRTDIDDAGLLQQTMYFDMWRNDAYLQFMYERLILLKELLAETGSIYVHLDWHVGHYVKLLMDEVFGQGNFVNEIVWCYTGPRKTPKAFSRKHDVILFYSKANQYTFNQLTMPHKSGLHDTGRVETFGTVREKRISKKQAEEIQKLEERGKVLEDWWIDIWATERYRKEFLGFSTQKPEALLERIIKASSNPGDLVLDCFVGSGTTVAVAQQLDRRWIGCDINKGAIQITSKRLQKLGASFATYKVNNYDLQLLRTEAIELAIQHIGIQRTKTDSFFDGTLGKNLVKIIDFNHPFTLLDFQLIQDELKKRPQEDRNITVVCLGKELAVDPAVEKWNKRRPYKSVKEKQRVNLIEVIELKTDKKYGNFLIHKPDEAKVEILRSAQNDRMVLITIKDFISPTIIERLDIDNTLFKTKIPDFRAMVDCVLIDTNYDGKTFHIVHSDVPEKKNDLIEGKYELEIPKKKTTVAVKIIDMLGEEVLVAKKI